MKATASTILFILFLLPLQTSAQTSALNGTWSGSWTPKGSGMDAVTIEIRQEGAGPLSGKFLNPAPMEFSKATYTSTTHTIVLEATDQKSEKHYKLEGKVDGNEIKGTLSAGEAAGDLRLIKWTFFGR